MSVPIFFVNQGNSFYLKYTLKQAKYFNNESKIYLLGDATNNVYPFIKHINLNKYQSSAQLFAGIYKHRSTNPHEYELFCFQRWFYIRDFLRENNIGEFIYLDSDVLAFYDFSKVTPKFNQFSVANTSKDNGMPAFSYFNSLRAIEEFCDYLMNYYSDDNLVKELDNWYSFYLLNSKTVTGGVCDMTLFDMYFKNNEKKTTKVDLVDDLGFDTNLRDINDYESDKGIKKLYWKSNLPFCRDIKTNKLVQFATLHYQGNLKELIITHYKGNGYVFSRLSDYLSMFFDDAKAQLKGKVKRLINYNPN